MFTYYNTFSDQTDYQCKTTIMTWIKFLLLLAVTSLGCADDYSGNGATKSSYSSDSGHSSRGRGAIHRFTGGWTGGVIPAAIQTRHNVEVRPVNLPSEPIEPAVVLVDAGMIPLTILFRSMSTALNVMQQHVSGQAAEEQHTRSEDEPHRLVHEVTKPIIQEVREFIAPFRRVVQEIQPVQEEVQTIVARGQERSQSGTFGATQLNNVANFGHVSPSLPVSQQPIANFGTGFTPQTNFIGTGGIGSASSFGVNQNPINNNIKNSFGSSFASFEHNRIGSAIGSSNRNELAQSGGWSTQHATNRGMTSAFNNNVKESSVSKIEGGYQEQTSVEKSEKAAEVSPVKPVSPKQTPLQTATQEGVKGDQVVKTNSNKKLVSPAKNVRAKGLTRNVQRNAQPKVSR